MSLIDRILKKEHKKELKLQQGVNAVQTAIEESNSSKEAVAKAVETIIAEIQKHPEIPIGDYFENYQKLDSDTLDTDKLDTDEIVPIILTEAMKQIPTVASEKAVVDAVVATDLPSQKIAEIIEDAPISPNVAQKIAEHIPDEDIQKEQQAKIDRELEERKRQKALEEEKKIVDTLSSYYSHCDNMEDSLLVAQVQQLGITSETMTPNIKAKLLAIIAKRTALDCMKYGGPKIATLSKIISLNEDLLNEMFSENLPQLAKNEYKALKVDFDEHNKKYHKYDTVQEQFVQEQLLSYIAKRSAQTFDHVGDFNLPKSKRFSQLSKEDRKFFIDRINDFLPGSLDETSKDILISELNGETSLQLQTLNTKLEKMDDKSQNIAMQQISKVLDSALEKPKSPTEEQIAKNLDYITSSIKQLPVSQQLIATKAICNALDKQKESMSKSRSNDSLKSAPTTSDEPDIEL